MDLSRNQKAYIDRSLQAGIARGRIPDADEVHKLVDGVGSLTFPIFQSSVDPSTVSVHSLATLGKLAAAANIDVGRLHITSTARSPEKQAQIMYEQLGRHVISGYAPAGQAVIDIYHQGRAAGKTRAAILKEMSDKMHEQLAAGGVRASNHLANLDALNVFDVDPSTMSAAQQRSFQNALVSAKSSGAIKQLFSPFTAHDPAFHIEVQQPSASN